MRQPQGVGTVDRERGNADYRRGLLTHAGLLLGTGYAPAVERVHAASAPYRMVCKGEDIVPSLSMGGNKALTRTRTLLGEE